MKKTRPRKWNNCRGRSGGGGGLERWEVVGGDQESDGIEDGIGRVKERGK